MNWLKLTTMVMGSKVAPTRFTDVAAVSKDSRELRENMMMSLWNEDHVLCFGDVVVVVLVKVVLMGERWTGLNKGKKEEEEENEESCWNNEGAAFLCLKVFFEFRERERGEGEWKKGRIRVREEESGCISGNTEIKFIVSLIQWKYYLLINKMW